MRNGQQSRLYLRARSGKSLFDFFFNVSSEATFCHQNNSGTEKKRKDSTLLQTSFFAHLFLLLPLISPFLPDSGVLLLGPYRVTNSKRLYILEWTPIGQFRGVSGPGGIPHTLTHRPAAICYH